MFGSNQALALFVMQSLSIYVSIYVSIYLSMKNIIIVIIIIFEVIWYSYSTQASFN